MTGSESALPEPYAPLIIPIIFGGLALPVIVSIFETRKRQRNAEPTHKQNRVQEEKIIQQDSNQLKKFYDTLEIDESSSPSEIKNAYRDGIRFYHPDKFETKSTEDQNRAKKKTKEIIDAYDELKKAGKVK